MKENRPRSLSQLLSRRGSDLGRIVRRASDMEQLRRCLVEALPVDVGTHIVGVNVDRDTLVLIVDGDAWAARVRYLQSECLSALETHHGLELKRLRVRARTASGG